MTILSDKEQKKQFKKEASSNPDTYYPTAALRRNGFSRYTCEKCGLHFWSAVESKVCGDPSCNAGFQVVQNNPSKNALSFVGVWKKIVEILEPRGYKPLKRYPVVARWNPTTEFTIASIAAFQPYVIAGEVPPPAKKLLIPQFSLRFGDIENVGITGSHCTGFVMIGQHQFVSPEEWDQDQAFQDIYDFLVLGVGLEKEEFKIHEDAWAGGGNFGPCMEFFSRGVELFNQVYMMFQQTPDGPIGLKIKVLDMGLGQERVAWFSQGTPNMYEAVFPLVLQRLRDRTKIILDHDLYNRFSQYSAFLNVDEVENMDEAWARVAGELNIQVSELREKIIPMTAIYSIAEHSRALLFAISDGKLPSNVGGGYNLRVIFRRAIGFIDHFGWDVDLADVCEWHAEELKEIFPTVSENLQEVRKVLNVEREKFYSTKAEAEKIVKKLVKKEEITLDKLIELYDSNGINPEIIQKAALKHGKKIVIPDDFYGKVIARHEVKEQIHATHKSVAVEVDDLPPTVLEYFEDYTKFDTEAKVLRITPVKHEIEDESSEEVQTIEINAWAVILDKTNAYPTSGGQIHDNGWINENSFVDVLKVGPCVVHICEKEPSFAEGDAVKVKIDKDRRILLTQHHSATHIVNAAAREYLGNHINQAGAKKTLNKAHLDITHFESLSDGDLKAIEKIANEIVQKGVESNNRFMSRTDAEQTYGMRLYQGGAVPGTSLRIVEIPGIDVEACGGTHVHNTKEVGTIKIIKAQKIQDGIVRLSFTAGAATQTLLEQYAQIEQRLGEILGCSPENILEQSQELLEKWKGLRKAKAKGEYDESMMTLSGKGTVHDDVLDLIAKEFDTPIDLLVPKIEKLKEEWETMKKEIDEIVKVVGDENVQALLDQKTKIGIYDVILASFPGMDNQILTNLAKNLQKQQPDLVLFLVGNNPGGFNFIAVRGESQQDLNLSKITKTYLNQIGGKGGGKPDSTQGFIPKYKGTAQDLIETFKKSAFSS